MFHADYILHQSRPLDKTSIINKFSDLVYDVRGQFKLEHLDRLIHSVSEDITDIKIQNDIIDGILSKRCDSLAKMFSSLSINEQFFVLAHLNLDLVTPKVQEPNPIFVSLVQCFVRELIVTGQ
ncbi:MAG: hypothetical protein K0R14_1410 [Burkholderiales bacterium]|jgi:hypothetical protein|nr:hypothetical protein [Burkholderiales bacterium]